MKRSQRQQMLGALLCVVVLCDSLAWHANAHGWLVDPVPRSGGGLGTGNASTGRPCGKAGPATVRGVFLRNSNVSVSYMRANGHGQTGRTVTFTLLPGHATAPTTEDFSTNGINLTPNKLVMDTGVATPQTGTLPFNVAAGNYILQFHWAATDGSNWFDCAYVTVSEPGSGPCATYNKCSAQATCLVDDTTQQPYCRCRPGYFGSGETCTASPDPVRVTLTIGNDMTQDNFTVSIAGVLGVPVSRINYDEKRPDGTRFKIVFSITSDDKGTNPSDDAKNLLAMTTRGDPAFASNFGSVPIVSVQLDGQQPRQFGLTSNDATIAHAPTALAATLVLAMATASAVSAFV